MVTGSMPVLKMRMYTPRNATRPRCDSTHVNCAYLRDTIEGALAKNATKFFGVGHYLYGQRSSEGNASSEGDASSLPLSCSRHPHRKREPEVMR